jgi:hypothetical protein
MYPSWWAAGVRVIGADGQSGTLGAAGRNGWLILMDAPPGEQSYVVEPDPAQWRPEVRQLLEPPQLDRIAHDCERALLRAFGVHYVPEFEALPDGARPGARPRVLGRPELAGLQNIIYGAVVAALRPFAPDA